MSWQKKINYMKTRRQPHLFCACCSDAWRRLADCIVKFLAQETRPIAATVIGQRNAATLNFNQDRTAPSNRDMLLPFQLHSFYLDLWLSGSARILSFRMPSLPRCSIEANWTIFRRQFRSITELQLTSMIVHQNRMAETLKC